MLSIYSHPYYEDHIAVVEQTLKDLDAHEKLQIKVFNKIDLIEDKNRIDYIRNKYKNSVIISAQRGINIIKLKAKITELIEKEFVEEDIDLNITESKKAAKIHSLAEVLSTRYDDDLIHITYKANKQNSAKIKKMVYGQ